MRWFCYHNITSFSDPVLKEVAQEVVLPMDLQPAVFDDPDLAQLASALPAILVKDKATQTVKTYISAFRRWKQWATLHHAVPLPADMKIFSLYLVYLIQQERSVAAVNSVVYGVGWVHKKGGFLEPAHHPVVKQVVEAARRILAKPPSRKAPLEIDVVRKAVQRLQQGNLAELQLAALIALGFFGFLRWDDLSRLTFDSIHFYDSHLALFLEKRKNDQFRDGSWVFISSSEVKPCPVEIVKKFVVQGKHSEGSKLFRRVQHTKNGWKLKEHGMSYSRANQLLKVELRKEGLREHKFSIHSLRAGGASAAAALGIPDRLFQRHGGWRSSTAKNNYLKESLNSLLYVTKTMHEKNS